MRASEHSWARYDRIGADDLFKRVGGVSDALYDELVAPLLHVLPMGPGEDISAAAALSCFHVFALQSRGAFDVRWCRGSISELIFEPWKVHRQPPISKIAPSVISCMPSVGFFVRLSLSQKRLEARGNVRFEAGARASGITRDDSAIVISVGGWAEPLYADGVVLAVGATSAARLLEGSPMLAALPGLHRVDEWRGITCVAVRLFLKGGKVRTRGLKGGAHGETLLPATVARAMESTPVVVVGPGIGGLAELAETGFCIYDLQRMHDEFASGEVRPFRDNGWGAGWVQVKTVCAPQFAVVLDTRLAALLS